MAELNEYVVRAHELHHDGEVLLTGAILLLTARQAAPLLDIEAIARRATGAAAIRLAAMKSGSCQPGASKEQGCIDPIATPFGSRGRQPKQLAAHSLGGRDCLKPRIVTLAAVHTVRMRSVDAEKCKAPTQCPRLRLCLLLGQQGRRWSGS